METKKREHKIYNASECCVFRKTKELYGGLSNMASGFPLVVNNVHILSSEALYQACRFPHMPDVQERVIRERSPMTAKMITKPYRENSRPDWNDTRIKIMKWCIRVKLAQNFVEFGKLLESTFDKPIVEDSTKDDFWGAIRQKEDHNIIKGTNALGRLLMELRQAYNLKRYSSEMFVIEPLEIPDFKLLGEPIKVIDARQSFISYLNKEMQYFEIVSPKLPNYVNAVPQPTKAIIPLVISPIKLESTVLETIATKPAKQPKPTKAKTVSTAKPAKTSNGKRANKSQTSLQF